MIKQQETIYELFLRFADKRCKRFICNEIKHGCSLNEEHTDLLMSIIYKILKSSNRPRGYPFKAGDLSYIESFEVRADFLYSLSLMTDRELKELSQ